MRYANGIHKETKQSREIDLQTEAESVIAEYDLFCPGCGAEAHFRHGAREEQADQRHDATEKTRKESNKKNHGYSDEHAPDCIIAKGTRIVRVYSDEYVDIDGMVAYRDKDRQGPTEGGQEPPCEPGEGKEPEKVILDDGDERFDPHAERRITNVKQLFEALSNRRTDEAVDVGESITVGEFMMDRRTASGLRENFRGGVKMVVTKRFLPGKVSESLKPPKGWVVLRDAFTVKDENALYFLVKMENEERNREFQTKVFGNKEEGKEKDPHKNIVLLANWQRETRVKKYRLYRGEINSRLVGFINADSY